ncbi:putative alpha/Beta hydrolase, lipase [Helianthus debilis subsp. tardiflorus]
MFLATSKPPFFPLIFNPSAQGFPSRPGGSSGGVRMEFVRKLGRKCCVVQSVNKNRKLEVIEAGDNVVSGEDIFYQVSAGAKVPPDHLLIMVNGIIGSAADWRYAAKQFVKRLPDKVIVHCSDCNSATLTFDGVDRMGERLAEEVLTVVQRWPEVSKISFIAHSLGGLVARYAIGRLYESVPISRSSNLLQYDAEQSLEQLFEAKIGGLQPVNFITVATPHLGSRGHRQLPFLCGLPFLERRAPQTAHWIVGRSGKHLFLTDNDNGGRPLLLQMVNDTENIKFMSALGSFKRRVAYANANFDQVVGWRTSSIRRQHELPKSNLLVKDEKYPHIMYVERETSDAIQNGISSVDIPQNLEEEMIRGLTQVPWERVDVSFHKSTQRYIAHTTIQVKNYWLNSDGADVVLHMIDNFLL